MKSNFVICQITDAFSQSFLIFDRKIHSQTTMDPQGPSDARVNQNFEHHFQLDLQCSPWKIYMLVKFGPKIVLVDLRLLQDKKPMQMLLTYRCFAAIYYRKIQNVFRNGGGQWWLCHCWWCEAKEGSLPSSSGDKRNIIFKFKFFFAHSVTGWKLVIYIKSVKEYRIISA